MKNTEAKTIVGTGGENEPSKSLFTSGASKTTLQNDFKTGKIPVAVYGLGKIGLPLAGVFAKTTKNTIGVDIDPAVIKKVTNGESHIENEPGLDELIAKTTKKGFLDATSDSQKAAELASVHVVIVPTLLTKTKKPNISNVEKVISDIGTGIKKGDMVLIESTVPPGTCRNTVLPLLQKESGLPRGAFGVAYCPERTSSGRALKDITESYPKIVGGIDSESTNVASLIYSLITCNKIIEVSDAKTAEVVKLFEGIYRDVNIALANEFANCQPDLGIDVLEAIQAANTQPYCDIHSPGPGVGGHCIPYYPYFLNSKVTNDTPLISSARKVNDGMPQFTVEVLVENINEGDNHEKSQTDHSIAGKRILILGLTYRAGVQELRSSPAKQIIELLNEMDAIVMAADPLVDDQKIVELSAIPVALSNISPDDLDGIILTTDHNKFNSVDWSNFTNTVIIDGRNGLEGKDQVDYTIGMG